jgi:LEA14-like dessication related protein
MGNPGRVMIASVMLILFGAGCSQPEAPEYLGLQNVQVMKADAVQSVLSADVKFFNPNAFNMQLKKAEMDIYLNDKLANHYLLDSTINIPAKDSFCVPVNLTLVWRNILGNAMQSIMNDQVKIKLNGHAQVKKGGFGFRVPILFEETEKLSTMMKGMF